MEWGEGKVSTILLNSCEEMEHAIRWQQTDKDGAVIK